MRPKSSLETWCSPPSQPECMTRYLSAFGDHTLLRLHKGYIEVTAYTDLFRLHMLLRRIEIQSHVNNRHRPLLSHDIMAIARVYGHGRLPLQCVPGLSQRFVGSGDSILLGVRFAEGGSALGGVLHTRRADSPNNSTVHRAKIAPVLMMTSAIENTNILNSLPAAPPSIINSVNPNFLTPGCPGGRISLSYLFTSLVNRLTPDSDRIPELTRDVRSIGSKTRDEAQEVHPSNLNLSFHSRPYNVTGRPCLSHLSSNFPTSRKLRNSKIEVN